MAPKNKFKKKNSKRAVSHLCRVAFFELATRGNRPTTAPARGNIRAEAHASPPFSRSLHNVPLISPSAIIPSVFLSRQTLLSSLSLRLPLSHPLCYLLHFRSLLSFFLYHAKTSFWPHSLLVYPAIAYSQRTRLPSFAMLRSLMSR